MLLLLLFLAVIVVVDPKKPPWKFGNNRVGNSWDIADIEFPVGGGVKSFACHTQLLTHQIFRTVDGMYDHEPKNPVQVKCKIPESLIPNSHLPGIM